MNVNMTDASLASARAYVRGVQILFAPTAGPISERGISGPASYEDLSKQAEMLLPMSVELTQLTAAQLANSDPIMRLRASTKLLAKALTDLDISAYLLQAAMDQEDDIAWDESEVTERNAVSLATSNYFKFLLDEEESGFNIAERGEAMPKNISTARVVLLNAIEDILALISERASNTGQIALGGLVGLGLAEVAQAASVVGMDIAQAFGQAEKLSRLYLAFHEFAIRTYDSLIALLGESVAQTAAQQVVEWVNELKAGKIFSELLEKFYETEQINQRLGQVVNESQVDLEKFVAAIQNVNGLDAAYRQQIDLAEKLLRGLRFLGGVPKLILPQSQLFLAAIYIILGAYVVLAGADYIDAQRLELLDRIPGVRRLVEINLSS